MSAATAVADLPKLIRELRAAQLNRTTIKGPRSVLKRHSEVNYGAMTVEDENSNNQQCIVGVFG
jgi:hypothetical protein